MCESSFSGFPKSSVLHIDTPGFKDVNESENDIRNKVLGSLKYIHRGFSYFFFVISLTDSRLNRSIEWSLRMLGDLLGD